MKILVVILGILMLSICLAGCTSQPATPTPVPTQLPVSTQPPMTFPVGVEWRLTSYLNGANVMTTVTGEKPVTAKFDSSGALSGSGGCNQYSATYKVNGTSISITQPITTLMACPEPIMQQESSYLSQLTKASIYNSLGDTLTLFDASGAAILVYKRPLNGVATQSPIVGVWDLFSYNNGQGGIQTVIIGGETTAVFQADGKLSGTGGCNQYSAGYTTTASNGITITQPISTLMACAEPIMQQETQYLSLLQKATKYEISGDQLTLFDISGTKLLIYTKHVSIPITGTWNLFNYNNGKGAIQSVTAGSRTTAVFGSNGRLSGSGGCNEYSAAYTTPASNSITISQPASTMMACAEPVMQQETQYFSLLPTASKFEISGDQLTLFNSGGTKILIYKSAGLKVNPL
jgi:heat shock protein HslJ